jgi:uncharacterized protein (TIGR03089 family)
VLTIQDLAKTALTEAASRPVCTFYDDATGERTELSGITLSNWVSKTANLAVDGYGLGPGDRATVRVPPHWQTAAVLLGCWSAGLQVDDSATAPADIAFLAESDRAAAAATITVVLGLHPMGLPLAQVPPGVLDYIAEVRTYGDHFTGAPISPDAPATPTATNQELIAQAEEQASRWGLRQDDRVLIDADRYPDPRDWLLAPLAAGASVVLCRHLDRAGVPARVIAERVSITRT